LHWGIETRAAKRGRWGLFLGWRRKVHKSGGSGYGFMDAAQGSKLARFPLGVGLVKLFYSLLNTMMRSSPTYSRKKKPKLTHRE
jgi:hypothetical protein